MKPINMLERLLMKVENRRKKSMIVYTIEKRISTSASLVETFWLWCSIVAFLVRLQCFQHAARRITVINYMLQILKWSSNCVWRLVNYWGSKPNVAYGVFIKIGETIQEEVNHVDFIGITTGWIQTCHL